MTVEQAPVAPRVGNTVHWINHYSLNNAIGFDSNYSVDSDFSAGRHYPTFEQLKPEVLGQLSIIFDSRF